MLLALCWLLAFTTRSWNRSGQLSAQLLAGLWFGSACIIGMLITSVGHTGIILDARTVVLSMAGLFGGPLVATIAEARPCESFNRRALITTGAALNRFWVKTPAAAAGCWDTISERSGFSLPLMADHTPAARYPLAATILIP